MGAAVGETPPGPQRASEISQKRWCSLGKSKAKTYTVKAYFEHQGTSLWVQFQVPMVQKEKKGGKMHKNMG